jgi:dienelactone hydrolase
MQMMPTPFEAEETREVHLHNGTIPALRTVPKGATEPLPCLVMQHGYGADKYDLAQVGEVAAGLGFITILPDAWGHGERLDPSAPNFMNAFSTNYFVEVVQHVADDLGTIAAELRGDPTIDPARIVLGGFSLGGITSILAAERDPAVGGVVAIAGGASLASLDGMLGMAPMDPQHAKWAEENDMGASANAAKLAPRPVMLLHGRHDDRLPVGGSLRLYEAAKLAYADQPDRLQLHIYDATHEITMPMLADAVTWLVEHFGSAA